MNAIQDIDRHGIGGNSGAFHAPTECELREWLSGNNRGLVERRAELATAVNAFLTKYPTIDDPDVAGAAADILEMLRKLGVGKASTAERAREAAKEPFLSGGRVVDAWFKTFIGSVEAIHARLKKVAQAYAEKIEAERREAAQREADRLAEEAAMREREASESVMPEDYDAAIAAAVAAQRAVGRATARPAALSQMTGGYGSTSSLAARWTFEYTDRDAVNRLYCEPSDTKIRAGIKAIEARGLTGAALAEAMAGFSRECGGVRVFEERDLRTRS